MGGIVAIRRSASERKFSDEFQGGLRAVVADLIKGETSCGTLLSYAVNEDESTVYREAKDSRWKLPFWRRRKIRGEWRKQVRSEVPILCMAGELISQYEPAYQIEDDTADARNAIPGTGSPLCSDSDPDDCNAPNKKSSTGKALKRGNSGMGGETKRKIRAEKRLTAALETPKNSPYYGNLDVSN